MIGAYKQGRMLLWAAGQNNYEGDCAVGSLGGRLGY